MSKVRIYVDLKKLNNNGTPFTDDEGNEFIKKFDPTIADSILLNKKSGWLLVNDPRLATTPAKESRENPIPVETVEEKAPSAPKPTAKKKKKRNK